MSENSATENESVWNKPFTRRAVVGGTTAAIGAAVIENQTGALSKTAGAITRALERFLNRPTEEQLKAARELERQDLVKADYEVLAHPDVIKMHGLAVRKDPYIPIKPNAGTAISTLQPGQTIKGIEWEGGNAKFPERQGKKFKDWIAFKDPNGRVGFVANRDDYIRKINPPANPSP